MTVAANKATARLYFERFINQGDIGSADTIFTTEVVFHYPLGELQGVDALKNYIEAVRAAFPDIHFKVEDLLGEDELVAARWLLTGAQTGELRGKPGTGKKVSVPGNTIFRLVDNRIAEMWVAFDPALLS